MVQKLLKRAEVQTQYTWNLATLVASDEQFHEQLGALSTAVNEFAQKYRGQLHQVKTVNQSLDHLRPIQEQMMKLGAYASLNVATDQSNDAAVMLQEQFRLAVAEMTDTLSFFETELLLNDEAILLQAGDASDDNHLYIKELLQKKQHMATPEVEQALSKFSQVFGQPYHIYLMSKLADMKFSDFTVDGTTYPMSFVLFENEWEYQTNHTVRQEAYRVFHEKLSEYQHGFAANFKTELMTQKALADLKGFDSVIDYLLFDQKVSADMYHRQIDVIMEKLSPTMRKYAKLLQEIHGLDKMTYADLKLAVDPEFEPVITIEQTRAYMRDGLAILGDDYLEMVEQAYDDRWIDFPQNLGKSTGAFCHSPYGAHPFILISWTERLRELFVLAHELGHAGHFYFAGATQNIFNTRASLYFIEAPSTMNELLMAEHLIAKAETPRMKRWVYASMISRTYYHNFVTHLLEAAFQRDVYQLVDEQQPISAQTLNDIMLKNIRAFWGDAVEIPDDAGMTWMRQPHYFKGLYPYTYSAGLTLSTAAMKKLSQQEIEIEQWKDMLKAGGTKDPVGLAKMVGVDLTTEQPLQETIQYIDEMVEQIILLSQELG